MSSIPQDRSGGGTFALSVGLGGLGAAAFFVGVGAAFERAGNWSDHLAGAGIVLLVLAGIASLAAMLRGLRFVRSRRSLPWWWPVSALLVVASVAGGVVALSL
jgi:hypothetical protein